MHEVYRLLRNNKELGPFQLKELIELDLKPTDLVWVEGKSASWCSPSEIDVLQTPVTGNTPALNHETIPETIIETAAKQTIPAHKDFQLGTNQHAHVLFPEGWSHPDSPTEDETSSAAKLEMKAEELYQRAQAYNAGIKPHSTGIEPRYSRSLDEMKVEYTNWRYFEKKKKKSTPMVALAVVVVVAGMFFTTRKLFFNNAQTAGMSSTETAGNKLKVQKTKNLANGPSENPSNDQAVILPVENIENSGDNNITVANNYENINDQNIPVSGKQVSKNLNKNIQVREKISFTKSAGTKENPVAPSNGNISSSQEKMLPDHSINSQTQISTPLSQVFSIHGVHPANNKEGVAAFKLTIKNNSDELRFAAVDVVYKKSNGEIAGMETLYFKKIAPHQSMTLMAPANKSADDVSYRVGLVSNEDGSIYYAQQ